MATYDETKNIILPVPGVGGSFDYITPTKEIILPVPQVHGILAVLPNLDIAGAVLHDDSPLTDTDYTTEANEDTANDVPLLPASPALNDGFYFGIDDIDSNVVRFLINIGTAGVGTWTITYYYWNGAWTALSSYVIYKSDQFLNFRTAGLGSLWIMPPSDLTTSVIGGKTGYFIFAKVTSFTSCTTVPLGNRVWYSQDRHGVKIRTSGAWKIARQGWQMTSGIWQPISEINRKVSGNWKTVNLG